MNLVKTIKSVQSYLYHTIENNIMFLEVKKMINDDIQWKPVVIGIIIAIAFYIVSDIVSGQNFILSTFLLAGIAVGFMVGTDIKRGAINGAITGVIAGIIAMVIVVAMYSMYGIGSAVIGALMGTFLTYLIIEVVLAIIGGVLGSIIKKESIIDRFPEKLDK